MKKSESDSESERNHDVEALVLTVIELEQMIRVLKLRLDAMERGDNTGLKHQNDGGWFD